MDGWMAADQCRFSSVILALCKTLPINHERVMNKGPSVVIILCLLVGRAWAEDSPAATVSGTLMLPSATEPVLEDVSLSKAAESLDRITLAWIRTHQCGSCHTGWPYMMSRALITESPSPAMSEVRQFFEARITNWDADEKLRKHWHREIVGTSTALVMSDMQTTGQLHSITRAALDRMWSLQRQDGAWNWPKCNWVPFEVDDYYGAVLAAVGVGYVPEGDADTESFRRGVERLGSYLRTNPAPNLHHRTWLLWAAVRVEGLLDETAKESIIHELLAIQRDDGGWSMQALGPEWVGREGEPADADAPSDGYGTGLVVFVLREAGIPSSHPAVQRGAKWLAANQRESGRWFTPSLNGVEQHYISDTATCFAVLALKACN